jgi:hypothetical protein
MKRASFTPTKESKLECKPASFIWRALPWNESACRAREYMFLRLSICCVLQDGMSPAI